MFSQLSRRDLLKTASCGFGYLALAGLCSKALAASAEDPAQNPLAPKPTHFPARAKRVIFLFMQGGPSHVDTFDYKPLLTEHDGQAAGGKKGGEGGKGRKLMKSPWQFNQHGQSGLWI